MVIINAPWDDFTIDALNRFQRSDRVHPFTCPNNHEGDRDLIAVRAGWICTHCDYTQNWAHDFMTKHPENFWSNNINFYGLEWQILKEAMQCLKWDISPDQPDIDYETRKEAETSILEKIEAGLRIKIRDEY